MLGSIYLLHETFIPRLIFSRDLIFCIIPAWIISSTERVYPKYIRLFIPNFLVNSSPIKKIWKSQPSLYFLNYTWDTYQLPHSCPKISVHYITKTCFYRYLSIGDMESAPNIGDGPDSQVFPPGWLLSRPQPPGAVLIGHSAQVTLSCAQRYQICLVWQDYTLKDKSHHLYLQILIYKYYRSNKLFFGGAK